MTSWFVPNQRRTQTSLTYIRNIKAVKQRLGSDICQHILFLCAVLGCDTTSRLHGIGKGISLAKYQTNNAFCEQANVHSASTYDVTCAGERLLIYNERSTDTLDSLRHQRFREKVASTPATGNLLRIIRCSCMTYCSTLRCTCKKHNIECTLAYGNCRGSGCTNSLHICHMTIIKTMTLRKYKSFDCSEVFLMPGGHHQLTTPYNSTQLSLVFSW